MKTLKRILGSVIWTCLFLVGCSSNIPPDEMAKTLYNFYIQEDVTNIDQLGITEEEATQVIEAGVSSFEVQLKESLQAIAGEHKVVIRGEDISKAIEARRGVEKKLSSSAEIISEEKDIAKVKLYTTYFDEAAVYEKANAVLEEKMNAIEIEDEDAFVQKCMDTYIEEIINAYNEIEVSKDTKSILIEFKKENNLWLPTKQQGFIDQLTELTSGYLID